MLEKFNDWLQTQKSMLEETFQEIEIVVNNADYVDKKSSYVNLISDEILARIVVWQSGESEIQIIDGIQGEDIFYRYDESANPNLLKQKLDIYLASITEAQERQRLP